MIEVFDPYLFMISGELDNSEKQRLALAEQKRQEYAAAAGESALSAAFADMSFSDDALALLPPQAP